MTSGLRNRSVAISAIAGAALLASLASIFYVVRSEQDILYALCNHPERSGNLFEIAGGVNEFEMVYAHGEYHLFTHDLSFETNIQRRSAPTVDRLSSAVAVDTGTQTYYPSIVEDDIGDFHLYGWRGAGGQGIQHYVSKSVLGPWRYSDVMLPVVATDPSVLITPEGHYLMAAKRLAPVGTFAIFRSETSTGPWEDMGDVLSEIPAEDWYEREQADPHIWYHYGKLYGAFAGLGSEQSIGIFEIDQDTLKAVEKPCIAVRPDEDWLTASGFPSAFNPTWVGNTPDGPRLYFSHNPQRFTDEAYGWGYIQAPLPLPDRLNRIRYAVLEIWATILQEPLEND